ncbi:hypothetical protein [Algicola sagamiensis]|uniref:hypothetical protein n=1 Tax=Algicola sagamiensis TaxID=163869 RepID=UPI0012F82942|nr:hypothetical protein [Algicola sagamiensis]
MEAKIKFYKITRCGYYERGSSVPTFGSVKEVLKQLYNWGNDGRSIVNTSCYESDTSEGQFNTYYCSSCANPKNEDVVLVLWGESPNNDNVIYGIEPLNQPGSTSLLTTDFGSKEAIPGTPSYFWFIPEKGLFATVVFDHSQPGKSNLERYITGFLENKSPYVIKNDSNEIIGFSKSQTNTTEQKTIYPRFNTQILKNKKLDKLLLLNIHNITRLIKKENLDYSVEDHRDMIEKIMDKLCTKGKDHKHRQKRTINHELQFSPTETELTQIIENFHKLYQDGQIKDVGFRLNTGKAIMLTGAYVTSDEQLELNWKPHSIVPPKELMGALTKIRGRLFKQLK